MTRAPVYAPPLPYGGPATGPTLRIEPIVGTALHASLACPHGWRTARTWSWQEILCVFDYSIFPTDAVPAWAQNELRHFPCACGARARAPFITPVGG